jgi:predicted nucleic acid-binding protein
MVLVDTSIWIDFLGGRSGPGTDNLNTLMELEIPFGLTPLIYQEILQGAASEKEFAELKRYLDPQRFFYLRQNLGSHTQAAHLYYRCRKIGLTIRSIVDILIAQTAIENGLLLLHNDVDFRHIQKVAPALKFY